MGGVSKAIASFFVPQDPPKPKKAPEIPNTDPAAAEAKLREETLARSRRGLQGLIATGPRGDLTATAAAPYRKSLLGE